MVDKEKILVTGSAGFIGFHLCRRLLRENFDVIGFNNINNYYSTELKLSRLKILKDYSENSLSKFTFVKGELDKYSDLEKVFKIAGTSNYWPVIVGSIRASINKK